jgi:nucleoside-diphosphate-sugar epimerase
MQETALSNYKCEVSTAIHLAKELVSGVLVKNRGAILVTGGAGFIGSHVALALLKERKKVIVFDLFNQETSSSAQKHENVMLLKNTVEEVNAKLNFDEIKAELFVVIGDIRDRNSLEELINTSSFNIETVVHAAGMVDYRRSISSFKEYFDVNINGTATLLDVLGKSGHVKRVVQVSSCSVFGEALDTDISINEDCQRRPLNPYAVSQVASDAAAHCFSHMHQIQTIILRLPSCYGYRSRSNMFLRVVIDSIANGNPIKVYGNGETTRTWLYIDDAVECILKAIFYGLPESHLNDVFATPLSLFEEFNIGSQDRAVSLFQVIETAEKVMGQKANLQIIDELPKGESKFTGLFDYEKASRVLGWEPQYNLERGMRVLKRYYSEANANNPNI